MPRCTAAKWFDRSRSEAVDRCNWPPGSLVAQIPHVALYSLPPARVRHEHRATSTAPAPSVGARSQGRQPAQASDRNRSPRAQRESPIVKFASPEKVRCHSSEVEESLNRMSDDRKTLEQRATMSDIERLRHSASHVLAATIFCHSERSRGISRYHV